MYTGHISLQRSVELGGMAGLTGIKEYRLSIYVEDVQFFFPIDNASGVQQGFKVVNADEIFPTQALI